MANPILNLFWPSAPADLTLICPAAPAATNQDPTGIFDPSTLASAYFWVNVVALTVVVVTIGICYLATRTTLGPRFVVRWWLCATFASALSALSALIIRAYPTTAFAGSCENNPDAFPVHVPWDTVLTRAAVGIGWGLVAYVLIALVLTQFLGRARWSGGFFHNRGYPWPRIIPTGE